MTARDKNAPYFEFFRKRIAFIRAHCTEADFIEGYILWGACVDSLAQIHAVCSAPGAKQKNRERFVNFLLTFAPNHHLDTVSVPLLMHDLRRLSENGDRDAKVVLQEAGFQRHEKAVAETSKIWQCTEDMKWAAKLGSLCAGHKELRNVLRKNRYADLLYLQYRNPAVHDLDLGPKTSVAGLSPSPPPWYMNHPVTADNPRPRTRIQFPIWYLVDLLAELTGELERRCAANGWTIPPNPTVKDC